MVRCRSRHFADRFPLLKGHSARRRSFAGPPGTGPPQRGCTGCVSLAGLLGTGGAERFRHIVRHHDPAAVLQSWLDSPTADEYFSRSEVYQAVVASRHHTLEHLRQIPADEILSRHEPEIALKTLLDHCGHSTERWAALAAAMTFDYDGEKITFGEVLDSLAGATAET